jgi:hypothetical protein
MFSIKKLVKLNTYMYVPDVFYNYFFLRLLVLLLYFHFSLQTVSFFFLQHADLGGRPQKFDFKFFLSQENIQPTVSHSKYDLEPML